MFLQSFQRPTAAEQLTQALLLLGFLTTIKLTDRFSLICIPDYLGFFRCRFHDNDELKLLLLIPNLPRVPPPTSTPLLGQQLQVLESSSASTKAQPLQLQPEQLQFTLVNQLS